jgi:hypothetical protein
MNQLLLVAVVVVVFCYWGGRFCPSVLKQNKEMLLGVAVGLVLCSFMGLRLEGFNSPAECRERCPNQSEQCGDQETGYWRERNCADVGGYAESHARGFTYDREDIQPTTHRRKSKGEEVAESPCINLYDEQNGDGTCAAHLNAGYTCSDFTSGPYIGYCDKECNVCQ